MAALALLVLLLVPFPLAGASAAGGSVMPDRHGAGTVVRYNSSVDGFALSYLEWLPAGYTPRHATPLVVFLHGMGAGTTAVTGGTDGNTVPATLVRNASGAGMILISLNTRTESGFYANTPCGGPQRQDVLDAIAHEQAVRKVGNVYLIGFSMGSIGALEIAGHYPGLIAGIGLIAPITDLYEEMGYGVSVHTLPRQYPTDLCGRLPSSTNKTAERITGYLSVGRFDPSNFSGIPIYVVAGAADRTVPNNFSLWSYAETNSTFVNATCTTSRLFGESANCTTPFWSLVQLHPSKFSFRYVWERSARHSVLDFPAGDFFRFLSGSVKPGFFSSSFPPGAITALPAPP